MRLGLGYSLTYGGLVSGLDPDARDYIAAVVAAGATVSSGQKSAIDTFFKTGKSDGWYSSLKRLYLPIWASAAPNAIDMIGLTSGTFNGTVTHAAGYVQGDGSTGYFDVGSSMASHGLTPASGWLGAIMVTAVRDHQYLGAQNSVSEAEVLRHTIAPAIATRYNDGGLGRNSSASDRTGIISASRYSGMMKHFRRTASSRVEAGSYTYANAGSMTSLNCYAIAINLSGVATGSRTSQMGGWWFGTGVTAAQDNLFTLALKNLWETCTGLSLS